MIVHDTASRQWFVAPLYDARKARTA